MRPSIMMGCVKYGLLCDSSRIRPGPYKSEWPYAACCFTDHCNKNLPLPIDNETGTKPIYALLKKYVLHVYHFRIA